MLKKDEKIKEQAAAPEEAQQTVATVRRGLASAPRRYRVEIINLNTLSRVWSIGFKGLWAILAAIGAVAALVSLIAMIFMFTPLGKLLPGQLRGDVRAQYINAALTIDSLEQVTRTHNAYTANIIAILSDSLPDDNSQEVRQPSSAAVIDTLIVAGEAERRFARQFDEEQRFNLSVLSPIAAEGMIFETPCDSEAGVGSVTAVYRGSVIAIYRDVDGYASIVMQHPGDFISIYGDMEQIYIERGDKVSAGQRIGYCVAARPLQFELWHGGARLNPHDYISY